MLVMSSVLIESWTSKDAGADRLVVTYTVVGVENFRRFIQDAWAVGLEAVVKAI